MSKRIY